MSCPLNLIFLFRACSLNDRFSSGKRIAHFVVRCFFFPSKQVFGKRFCYNRADDKFSIEPAPPRTCYVSRCYLLCRCNLTKTIVLPALVGVKWLPYMYTEPLF